MALEPSPAVNVIFPPTLLAAVVSPAEKTISPPLPVVPAPTEVMIEPPFPFVALPVTTEMRPLSPELVVPVENERKPLIPVVPAFAVWTTIEPLDRSVPWRVKRDIDPPVKSVLLPVEIDT